jgi:hypothetical protein
LTAWTPNELAILGETDELKVSTQRSDSSWRHAVPVWVVRVDDAVYVRSYRGTAGAWFRHAAGDKAGAISVPGLELEVRFEPPPDDVSSAVDQAYRAKYARYGPTYLTRMLAPAARAATLQITPQAKPSPRKQGATS